MKLFYAPASPFVRKVMIVANELGLAKRIETVTAAAHPINRDASILPANPLGQIPTLVLDDGSTLFDSRVICEWLDAEAGGNRFFPSAGAARWRALREQSLGDGIANAALLARYEEAARPPEKQFASWRDGQLDKVRTCVDAVEGEIKDQGNRFDIGGVAIFAALNYLDLRFPDLGWRTARPNTAAWFKATAERPSVKASA